MSLVTKTTEHSSSLSNLKDLEQRMNREIISQAEAVNYVAQMIKTIKTNFHDKSKPRGVVLLAGPTGVGKTELAKITAQELRVPLHRFDMSEFSEPHTVSRLIGSPPGYAGSDEGGELTNKLRSAPTCVVLFDEIEKADPKIFKVFLQLFQDGRLTDSKGQLVNAKEAVFLLTTNLGAGAIYQHIQNKSSENLKTVLKPLFIHSFSPELYNRFDETLFFKPLGQEAMEKIAEKYLTTFQASLAQQHIKITWDPEVPLHLSKLELDLSMGARDLHRRIREQIQPRLSACRIEGEILDTNVEVHLQIVNEKLELVVRNKGTLDTAPSSNADSSSKGKKTATKKAMTVEKGVVHLDLATDRPLEELVGLYIYRAEEPKKTSNPQLDAMLALKNPQIHVSVNCQKVTQITKAGEILYETKTGTKKFMHPRWNDGKWRPITPARNGRAFFENICTVLPDSATKTEATKLVKTIFGGLKKDCHLDEQSIYRSLKFQCIQDRKLSLVKEVEKLERLLDLHGILVKAGDAPSSPTNSENPKDPSGNKIISRL
jgi:SpoVK/Ycf46/Vps4 family AAA+-type ATPase